MLVVLHDWYYSYSLKTSLRCSNIYIWWQLRIAGLSYSLGITLANQIQVRTSFLATIFTTTVCMHANSLESCLTLCNPVDCSMPGSSVHGILQARILKWVAVPSSKGSSWPRDWTRFSNVSFIYDLCQDESENRNLLWNIQKHFNLSFYFASTSKQQLDLFWKDQEYVLRVSMFSDCITVEVFVLIIRWRL